jgi:hypothetical protein
MVLARLARPDALEVLAGPADDGAAAARAEATELRARLDGFYEQAALGKVSPGGLAKIEARLLPAIEVAQGRARTVRVPPLLRQAAGPDAATVWERLTVGQRREVISLLVDLRVAPTVRGSRFDPRRLGDSRWIGDQRTWGPQIKAFLAAPEPGGLIADA